MFLNKKAYEAVANLIINDGEFLEVVDENGNQGFVFTPLRVAEDVNGLDLKLSQKNEWNDVVHLAFNEEAVKNWALFRTKYNNFMTLHCQEAVKKAIEDTNLAGLYLTNDLGNIFPKNQTSFVDLN